MDFKNIKNKILHFSAVLLILPCFCACNGETDTVPETNTITQSPASSEGSIQEVTSTPTPEVTLTPVELSVSSDLKEALENNEGAKILKAVSDYYTAYYSGDYSAVSSLVPEDMLIPEEDYREAIKNVKNIESFSCFYKSGVDYADYIVYFLFDKIYTTSSARIPEIADLCISFDGAGNPTVYPLTGSDEVEEAMLQSRKRTDVLNLFIKQTIQKSLACQISGNEDALNETFIDGSVADMQRIIAANRLTEDYELVDMFVNTVPYTITEIDYIVYVTEKIKFIGIDTVAPGLEEYLIKLNEDNLPRIFVGTSSDETDLYRKELMGGSKYSEMAKTVTEDYQKALESDPELYEFVKRMGN